MEPEPYKPKYRLDPHPSVYKAAIILLLLGMNALLLWAPDYRTLLAAIALDLLAVLWWTKKP
jgi:hypothetical protein